VATVIEVTYPDITLMGWLQIIYLQRTTSFIINFSYIIAFAMIILYTLVPFVYIYMIRKLSHTLSVKVNPTSVTTKDGSATMHKNSADSPNNSNRMLSNIIIS
jgi:hypothetical protein